MKTILTIGAAIFMAAVTHAQTPPPVNLEFGVGQPLTINGQTFIAITNSSGGLTLITTGPAGNVTNTPPRTTQDMLAQLTGYVAANNPSNAYYYGTNEIEVQAGAVYLQNSGQAAAELDIEKWGLFSPNFGAGAAVLEGSPNGQNGTAGFYGHADYRKVIGDVAGSIGAGGGYDELNASPVGVVRGRVEYRFSPHLGSYVGASYAIEKKGLSSSGKGGGLIIGGGLSYAF